jgi:hypothetical protein
MAVPNPPRRPEPRDEDRISDTAKANAQQAAATEPEQGPSGAEEMPPAGPAPHKEPYPASNPNVERTSFGPGLWLEIEKTKGQVTRRVVVVNAAVCLREGQYGLECLLCRKNTKEHEAILSTEAVAEKIHALLIVCGGKPGAPVKFEPKYTPPHGPKVKISLVYKENDKLVRVPAQEWVLDKKTKKDLSYDWVFTGSLLWRDDLDEKKPVMRYAANGDGAYVCVTNVPTAMIDLPISSSNALEERTFVPITSRIPELGTKVDMIFEVVAEEKKK